MDNCECRHKQISATDSQMTGLYLINTAGQKIKVQLKDIEQQKFQGMLAHFISRHHGSLITITQST